MMPGNPSTDNDGGALRAIDQAKRHFSGRGVVRFEVPEWADDQGRPLVITAQPLTLKDKDHLAALGRRYGKESYELMAHILILHARDDQGRPLFDIGDKVALMNQVDPDVLGLAAMQIVAGPSVEDQKKN